MELKPGYKETDVGVIPEDWVVTPFTSIGDVIDGDRGANYPGKRDFSSDGYCLFLNAGNVTKTGFRFKDCAFISREKDERLSKGKLKRDDIVLTTRGTVGNFAYFDSSISFDHIRINSGMVILRRGDTALDTRFLFTQLQSHIVERQIERLTFGSAQPQLTVNGISKFLVVIPSIHEQRAIASALSDVDALLDGIERLIAKKRDLKQAVMQQLLTGKTRLPGFEGEWEVKKISELLCYERPDRFIVKSSEYEEKGNTPVLTANKSFILGYTYEDFGVYHNLPVIIFDDFTTDSKYVDFPFKVKSSAIKILKTCNAEADLKFIFERMRLIKFPLGEHKRYYISEYQSIELPTPKLDEQTAITQVLSDMDAEIAALEQRRNKTKDIKQAMMQELLTGKTRLVTPGGSNA